LGEAGFGFLPRLLLPILKASIISAATTTISPAASRIEIEVLVVDLGCGGHHGCAFGGSVFATEEGEQVTVVDVLGMSPETGQHWSAERQESRSHDAQRQRFGTHSAEPRSGHGRYFSAEHNAYRRLSSLGMGPFAREATHLTLRLSKGTRLHSRVSCPRWGGSSAGTWFRRKVVGGPGRI
jgi:hypothetical protein